MLRFIGSFIAKALPTAAMHMAKPAKGAVKYFAKAGKSIAKTKAYKFVEDFLGEKPGTWAKKQAHDALKNGQGITAAMGFIKGLTNNWGSEPVSNIYPQGTPRTSTGAPVPGAALMNQGITATSKSFNTVSRGMHKFEAEQTKQNTKNKKLIDSYQKNITKKDFSIGELSGLGADIRKTAEGHRGTLTSNIKGSKAQALRSVRPSTRMKSPIATQDQTAKEVNNYLNQIITQLNDKQTSDLEILNSNLETIFKELNKKEEMTAEQMLKNIGRYNEVTLQKLGEVIAKAETVSFKKQQESAYHQTGMLSDKLDSAHSYNTKGIDTLRAEIMANTQTMYAINKQNRAIDEEYRALEEKKNQGITLSNIYTFCQQIARMVQLSFRTPQLLQQNMKDAVYSIAESLGYELGAFAQTLKEINVALIKVMENIHKKVKGSWILDPLVWNIGKALTWTNKKIFTALLGLNTSGVENMLGGSKYFDIEGDLSEKYEMNKDSGAESESRNIGQQKFTVNAARKNEKYRFDSAEDYSEVSKTGKGTYTSVTGEKLKVDSEEFKKRENENDFDYKMRIAKVSSRLESENIILNKDNKLMVDGVQVRVSKNEARKMYADALESMKQAYVKYEAGYTKQIKGYRPGYVVENHVIGAKDISSAVYNRRRDFVNAVWQGEQTVLLVPELIMRVSQCLQIAANLGIPFRINDTIRDIGYEGYSTDRRSPHMQGVAVDIQPDWVIQAVSEYAKNKGFQNYKGTIGLQLTELEDIVLNDHSKYGLSKADYERLKNWWLLLMIFKKTGEMTIGNGNPDLYPHPKTGKMRKGERNDLVHIQISDTASVLNAGQIKRIAEHYKPEKFEENDFIDPNSEIEKLDIHSSIFNMGYDYTKDNIGGTTIATIASGLGDIANLEGSNRYKYTSDQNNNRQLQVLGGDGQMHNIDDIDVSTINNPNGPTYNNKYLTGLKKFGYGLIGKHGNQEHTTDQLVEYLKYAPEEDVEKLLPSLMKTYQDLEHKRKTEGLSGAERTQRDQMLKALKNIDERDGVKDEKYKNSIDLYTAQSLEVINAKLDELGNLITAGTISTQDQIKKSQNNNSNENNYSSQVQDNPK